ncbi:MAG: hypothetical protein ACI87E_003200 [Mariniblastus sp.]|jgi:hypothetical protein
MNSAVRIQPPQTGDFHEFYKKYIDKVGSGDFLEKFSGQPQALRDLLSDLPKGEDSRLHEPFTWTLKQVVGHLIDGERVFSCRLLRIASGDTAPISGFDQNLYVSNLDYKTPSMVDLLAEFDLLRQANVLLLKRLQPESLDRVGMASDNPVTAKANLFILVGHVNYHLEIINRRLA